MVATARQCLNRPLCVPVGLFHPREDMLFHHGTPVTSPSPPRARHVRKEDALGQAMRKQQEAMPMQKQSSGFASPPPVLGKDTTFSCWSLNQHLLGGNSLRLHVLLAADRGPGDPDSTGAHLPTGQGGFAVPKALETPAVPQTATHHRAGCSSHLNTALCWYHCTVMIHNTAVERKEEQV